MMLTYVFRRGLCKGKASKVRSALFAFSKVVYAANKEKQYRVFKEEVRSLASEVAAKHL